VILTPQKVKIIAQRIRLWFFPKVIDIIERLMNYLNPKYQIPNIKQIPMTEIRKSKQCIFLEGSVIGYWNL